MMLGMLAALTLALQGSGDAPTVTREARPLSNPGTWITEADYPPDALIEGVEGRVAIAFEVGIDGRVSSCRITDSSGNASLDAATCRLVQERGRYEPAQDAASQPVVSRTALRLSWSISEWDDGSGVTEWERGNWHWTARMRFAEDGSIASCSSTGSHPYGGGDPCSIFRTSPPPFAPFSRPRGFGVELFMEGVQRFDGAPIRLSPPQGGTALSGGVARFTLRPDGAISTCSVVDPDRILRLGNPCYVVLLRYKAAEPGTGDVEVSSAQGAWVVATGR